jgi:hypothetical protein
MAQRPTSTARASIGHDISILVLFFPLAFLTACGSSGGGQSGTCPEGQVLRYESPGCGADAKPVCGSKSQDACYRAVCSCRGETISRCDYATEPFAYFGICPIPDGAGPDVPSGSPDVANDVAGDLPVEGPDTTINRGGDGAVDKTGLDVSVDRGGDSVADGGIDGPPVGPSDLAIDIKSPIDGPGEGGAYDSGPCPAGQVLRYQTPGCGADAKPVCGSPQQDACARPVCSCNGVTISRCDYAPEPYASAGACDPYDGGLRE